MSSNCMQAQRSFRAVPTVAAVSNCEFLVDNNQFAADTYQVNYPHSNYLVEDLGGGFPSDLPGWQGEGSIFCSAARHVKVSAIMDAKTPGTGGIAT